jgi:hypothetical protein
MKPPTRVRRGGGDVDLHDAGARANRAPKRIVNWLSPAPNTTATSAVAISSMAPSAPKPAGHPEVEPDRGRCRDPAPSWR